MKKLFLSVALLVTCFGVSGCSGGSSNLELAIPETDAASDALTAAKRPDGGQMKPPPPPR